MFQGIKNVVRKMLTTGSIQRIGFDEGSDDYIDTRMQYRYKDSLYVSRSMEIITDAVSSIDFFLYRIKNTKGETEKVPVSPVIDLLYKPNPLQTKSEFWSLLIMHFKLSGEFFVRKVRQGNKIVALIAVSPLDVDVDVSSTGIVQYRIGAVTVSAEDMIHVKKPDPTNPLRGHSALRPLAKRILAEVKSVDYQANIFGKNGNPDGVLMSETGMDQDSASKLKTSFYNSYRGVNETNRIAFMYGGKFTYTPIGSTTLDYTASLDKLRDDVCMALGVPKALVTSDDVNRSNADAALRYFMQFTIAPIFTLVMEAFNERMVCTDFGDDLFINTGKIVTDDRELMLKEVPELKKSGIITANEARERYGYEPIDGADVLATSASNPFGAPLGMNAFRNRPMLYKRLVAEESVLRSTVKSAYTEIVRSPAFKAKYTGAMENVRAAGERMIEKIAKTMFDTQAEQVLAKLKGMESIASAGEIFDVAAQRQASVKAILPSLQYVAQNAGNVALTPVKIAKAKADNTKPQDSAFLIDSVVFAQIEGRAKFFADSVTDTTYQAINTIIADNLHEGIPAVTAALREMFDDFSATRAAAIARTESCFMTSLGTQLSFEQSAVVEGKIWYTSNDTFVRRNRPPENHVMNNEVIVGKDERFPNGEKFPGEQTINCRCAIAPIINADLLA